MTLAAASIIALALLPSAALKPTPVPTPGPATTVASTTSTAPRIPPAHRQRYELFEQKCGRCHGVDKALEATYAAGEWDGYLKKKLRRNGAGISPQQAAEIGAFLRYWATAKK
jgi:mono/diheme cytochrome c family protein